MFHSRILAVALSAILPSLVFSSSTRTETGCRCFPGDDCWPTPSQWQSLNQTLGGKLIPTIPLASACHVDSFEAYDEEKCRAVQEKWFNPEFHIDSASSVMAPFFANQSCNPFAPKEDQCIVGAYVQYAVDASTVSDFITTIQFATAHNIRLVIRNTAHDWLGKSTGPGALALRTRNLKDMEIFNYNSTYYTGKAMKVGAGVNLGEAFKKTNSQGLVNVGGTSPSVGLAGGFTQGTGHGLTVSKFGLGADQALEWEAVIADGNFVKATPINEHSDLYWALSGGGGGTYAAVVSLTLRVHEDSVTTGANLSWTSDGMSQDIYYKGIESFVRALPGIVDAGAGGNWVNSNTSFTMSPFVGAGISKSTMDGLFQQTLDDLNSLGIKYSKSASTNDIDTPSNYTYSIQFRRVPLLLRHVHEHESQIRDGHFPDWKPSHTTRNHNKAACWFHYGDARNQRRGWCVGFRSCF
jgi:hypothetical protein